MLKKIIFLNFPDSPKFLNPGLLLGLCYCLIMLLPVSGFAQKAVFYQKGLTPVETDLLFNLQEMMGRGEYQRSLVRLNKFRRNRSQVLPPLLGFVAGNLNFQLGNFQEAVKLYRRVVEKAPEFNQAYENYGLALLQSEMYPAACRVFLKASTMMPGKSGRLRYKAAIAALYGEDLKKGRAILLELISAADKTSSPPPADWLKALVRVHWQLSELQPAVAVAGRLVDLYPDEITHWRLYGHIAIGAKSYRKALSAYAVLATEGNITLAERKQVIALYQELGLFSEAAQSLEEIYNATEPTKKDLERLLALYRRSGETDKALLTLSRMQKLYPDSMNLFTKAEILYAAGRYDAASVIFLSLDKIKKNDGRQFILAGYCAWNLDNFPAAAQAWQKATQYSVWRQTAQDLLQSLYPLIGDSH